VSGFNAKALAAEWLRSAMDIKRAPATQRALAEALQSAYTAGITAGVVRSARLAHKVISDLEGLECKQWCMKAHDEIRALLAKEPSR